LQSYDRDLKLRATKSDGCYLDGLPLGDGAAISYDCEVEVGVQCQVRASNMRTRHQSGDGGNVPPEDAEENELAIGRELRILSRYGDGEDDDRL
jgi:hypothetical protein